MRKRLTPGLVRFWAIEHLKRSSMCLEWLVNWCTCCLNGPHFKEGRAHAYAKEILGDFSQVLHSDKYGAYEGLAQAKDIIWSPCWVHIRRKFYDAQGDPPFRESILNKIGAFFFLEKEGWELSAQERLQMRQEQAIPIIDELITQIKEKSHKGKVLPKSHLSQALKESLNNCSFGDGEPFSKKNRKF